VRYVDSRRIWRSCGWNIGRWSSRLASVFQRWFLYNSFSQIHSHDYHLYKTGCAFSWPIAPPARSSRRQPAIPPQHSQIAPFECCTSATASGQTNYSARTALPNQVHLAIQRLEVELRSSEKMPQSPGCQRRTCIAGAPYRIGALPLRSRMPQMAALWGAQRWAMLVWVRPTLRRCSIVLGGPLTCIRKDT
jgi:hypothetical protein